MTAHGGGGLILLALLSTSGCTYPGSVYSQYSEVNIMVAVRPEEAKPIDVNFGYNRGVAALVPKMRSNRYANESAALLSRERITSTMDVIRPQNTNLTVDAAFITGNAAIIASIPNDNTPWEVLAEDGATVLYAGKTQGGAGDRLRAAFQPTAQFSCPSQKDVAEQLRLADSRGVAERDRILDGAAQALPRPFQDQYASSQQKGADKRSAFGTAFQRYTQDEEACGPRYVAVLGALKNAFR